MYQFFVVGKKVICVSSYAGKPVRGVAKCAPDDEFDEDFGRRLAQTRCDFKVAQKRFHRAISLLQEANEAERKARKRQAQMMAYVNDACADLDDLCEQLNDLDAEVDGTLH